MTEVEKLYELAESDRDCNLYKNYRECPMKHTQCEDCENFVYPPFTAEKQIELIKLLLKSEHSISYYYFENRYGFVIDDKDDILECEKFEHLLALAVNFLWQDLTEEERTQIKEILE